MKKKNRKCELFDTTLEKSIFSVLCLVNMFLRNEDSEIYELDSEKVPEVYVVKVPFFKIVSNNPHLRYFHII